MTGSGTSIARKLSLIVICAVLLAIAIATGASAWREAERFAAAKRAELTGTANVFASAVADDLAVSKRQQAYKKLRAIANIPGLKFARVEDTQGRRFAEIGASVVLETNTSNDSGLFSLLGFFNQDSIEVAVDIVKSGQVIGRLKMVADSSELRDRLNESLIGAVVAALIAAAFGIAVTRRMQRRITAPIQNLTRAMADVRETQDFSKQVERQSDDETGTMVDAFNDMLVNIRERDDRLAEHRANLEIKVEERTADLRTAKEAAESANVAKSEFLATMSHEIRTPMNGMLVMAELISGAELAPRQQRYAEVIVKSGQSLLSIINDILDFSKIESGSMEMERIPVDPAEVIDDVLNLFWERASSKGLDLAGYVDAGVPARIEADPVRLNQVLSNLVNNALKFTETGHVCVICRTAAQQPGDDGITLEFGVKDTGIGIPEDKIATVFSAFSQADQSTTRKYGGTGLGLAICKKLVQAMGGQIGASSTPGEGSVFSFSLATRSVEDVPAGDHMRAGSLKSALVSLDGSITPVVIASYLRAHGIEVQQVSPDNLTPQACQRADAVFLAPGLVPRVAGGALPYLVCVSELGDSSSDDHLESGQAHDLLMRPVSRQAIEDLIARLAAGTPLGRNATRRATSSAAELPDFTGTRVLVADDSAVNREVIIEALSRLNVEPDVVADGREAVDAVATGGYDLVLMDCSMPVMDGFAATRAIRETESGGERLPVIALTAHVAGGPVDMWKTAGMDDCVTKPFTLKALAACFEQWLPGRAQSPSAAPPPAAPADPAPAPDPAHTPAPTDDGAPVIDDAVLEMLGEMAGDDGAALLERVFGLYEAHAPDALESIELEVADDDREAIAKAAHALKSMSFNVGARRVGDACEALEAAARTDADTALAHHLDTIKDALAQAINRIGELRAAA